jgi:Rap1a immunity proteins
MHRLFFRAAILAGLLFPFSAASQEVRKDVQELYELCKHESGRDFCLGYISGIADHMLLNGAFLRSHGKGFREEERDLLADLSACPKTTESFGNVVQTFLTWAEKHPEEQNLTMHLGVVEALSEIWPCD